MVSTHFISLLYEEKENGVWVINESNDQLFQNVLDGVSPAGDLSTVFESWWETMKYWIRYCCPNNLSNDDRKLSVPDNDDQFLLHAALLNCDTPPRIVSLLLALYPLATSMCLPGTSLLPLHIAAWTTEYAPAKYLLSKDEFIRHVSSNLVAMFLVLFEHSVSIRTLNIGNRHLSIA